MRPRVAGLMCLAEIVLDVLSVGIGNLALGTDSYLSSAVFVCAKNKRRTPLHTLVDMDAAGLWRPEYTQIKS